ncbi:hypothetical protein [Calothrix sp. 336/3]|nr:hypothetical protein [Calothrix sp. 336/3]
MPKPVFLVVSQSAIAPSSPQLSIKAFHQPEERGIDKSAIR